MKTTFKRKIMPAGLSSNAVVIPAPLLGMFNVTKGDHIIFEWDMKTDVVTVSADKSLENINSQMELPFEETCDDNITRLSTESDSSISECTNNESGDIAYSFGKDNNPNYPGQEFGIGYNCT